MDKPTMLIEVGECAADAVPKDDVICLAHRPPHHHLSRHTEYTHVWDREPMFPNDRCS
ncbi:MAG: hypothetical protein HOB73_01165 [Planctomycetaceae bacterium]|nr:hypothetical protein [Planctomycetaceae bacterium]